MVVDRAKLSNTATWILVLCAIASTLLLAHHELRPDPRAVRRDDRPEFIESWREGLQLGIRTGSAEAPVQLIEFADFECPACAKFESTLQQLRVRYPEQVAVTFAHSPIDFHQFAEAAARAAECADEQGHFERMRTVLFSEQQAFGTTSWGEFAKRAAVPDLQRFNACLTDSKSAERIAHGKRLTSKFRVRGTPTILVNGWKLSTPPTAEELDRMIRNVLDGKSPVSRASWWRWWT